MRRQCCCSLQHRCASQRSNSRYLFGSGPALSLALPLLAFALLGLVGCAGLTSQTPPPPPQISVTMNTGAAQVVIGHTQDFSVQIQNDSKNEGVSWTLSGTGCTGATCGTLTNVTATSVTYAAPATVPNPATVTLKATAVADTSKSGSTTITIMAAPAPISVAVNPPSASVQVALTAPFTAQLQNDTQNKGVTWSLSGTGCAGAACGTLTNVTTTSVTYNAPATAPSPATVALKATSAADNTKTSSATITVTTPAPLPISVGITPPSTSVQVSLTAPFTAQLQNDTQNKGVTWSLSGLGCTGAACGTLTNVTTAGVTYNAPATAPNPATVTLTATSVADATKSGSSTITITAAPAPISVAVLPPSASVQVSLTAPFTAQLQNDTQNKGVTWSLSGAGCTGAACGTLTNVTTTGVTYNAPASVPNPATVTLKATSVADATKSGSSTITITAAPAPISVAVLPTSASVQVSLTAPFTAQLQNDTQNKGVTWSLSGTGCTAAACGTLTNVTTTSVTYNAPATAPTPATVTLTATSIADATKSGSATITITTLPPPVTVAANPPSASVQVSLTAPFTAQLQNDTQNKGVTWSLSGTGCTAAACGTLTNITTTSVTYNAPATAPTPATVTLTATSIADATKSGSATITITTPTGNVAVSVSPKRAAITTSQTQTYSATVTGSANTSVTWEIDSVPGGNATSLGTIDSNGKYTPPTSGTIGGAHIVTARSAADTTVTATAAIAVTDLDGVFTHHNDTARTGANLKEFGLTTATVTTATFGKLFQCTIDAAAYAQPLWVANLTVNGARHNVIYVATQHNTVYAFDADNSACQNLWGGPKSLNPSGETFVTSNDVACTDLVPDIGIVGTPVIDPVSNTIYIVTKTKNSGTTTMHQRLHALDLATGAEKGTPTEIQAQVNGTGNESTGGKVPFDPLINNERPALLLSGNHVIISWASHCDNGPYHGWVMSYNATTLAQEAVHNVSPNGALDGIWMSGGGPAADSAGNIYYASGNGSWNGTDAFGDSIVRLGPVAGNSFGSIDYFTPTNQDVLSNADTDVGSGGLVLLPDLGSGAHPRLLVQAGKEGKVYLVDRDNMGKMCLSGCIGGDPQIVQELPGAVGGMWASPTYWNGSVYFGGNGDSIKAFSFNAGGSGKLSTSATSSTSKTFGFPGASPSVSSSGNTNGILWALDNGNRSSTTAQHLYAWDATNLANMLYNSTQSGARDTPGGAVKFTVPTVANGKVYAAGQTTVTVYGLLPN